MSLETVYALRRFTQKLQKTAAEGAEPELILPDPNGAAKNSLPPRGVSPGPGLVPNITTPPKPFTMKAYDDYTAEKNPSLLSRLAGLGQYMPSMPVLGGIGLGGLGAYGLARTLRSKDEDEERGFPWLATLLGAGGGGALAAYLQSQTHAPGTPMASPNHLVDRMVTDPRVMAPNLQQTRPLDVSGVV